jgi:aspartyl/asparaginyl beta-hydroxylase (cupin superfamily)
LYHKRWIWEPTNKIETITWQQQDGITFGTRSAYDTIKQHYPKLTEMIDKLRTEYGIDSVNKVTYSILVANGNIGVHTGRDNIHSEYIRCHIPLIIPEHTRDEMYLEANADKVYWTETWGFDNQIPHTAKNATDYHRLVLIIDISRDALCITKKKKSWKLLKYIKRQTKIYTNQGREYN